MAKLTLDYKHLKAEQMKTFIEENHPEDKKEFKATAFVMCKPITMVGIFEEGKPKMYVDKNGKLRQKRKAMETSGAETLQFKLLIAKQWFYEKYKEEINFTNVPVKKSAEKKPTATDMFADW